MRVLHLTAHLGGGVGKALSGLVTQAIKSNSRFKHTIVCFEKPEKNQFVERVLDSGSEVIICPGANDLEKLAEDSDIVQLEWWNHPATIKNLCSLSGTQIRLLTWCHVSGLFNPVIPPGLMQASQKFLFTSECSLEGSEVKSLLTVSKSRFGVVPSSGGFPTLPEAGRKSGRKIEAGYIGSLNFAKLHPRYVEYLAAVKMPGFRVKIIGDPVNQDELTRQCQRLGKPWLLEFRGYAPDIASELSSINVLAYLLNPEHYGTTENALIEAMAAGVVPVVLDNPAEIRIVENHCTGLTVHSPGEFAEAIEWLANYPEERQKLGKQAAQSVRTRFSVEKTESSLNFYYDEILAADKKKITFTDIFGRDPAEWFLSCQRDRQIFMEDGSIKADHASPLSYSLFEKTKGTVFHFHDYFPDNPRLESWARHLKPLQQDFAHA